jgi:hypothetical protein
MNIIDRMMDHDLTPGMGFSEYTGKMEYDPGFDPLFVDHSYFIADHIVEPMIIPGAGQCKAVIMFNAHTDTPFNEKDLTPRFHLFNEDGSFSCCISFLEPVYFDNEYEHSRLDKEGKEILNRYMRSPRTINRERGIFKRDDPLWLIGYIEWVWNNWEPETREEIIDRNNYSIPDYTQLPD